MSAVQMFFAFLALATVLSLILILMIQPTSSKNKRATTSQRAISTFFVSNRQDSVAEAAGIDVEGQNEADLDEAETTKKPRILRYDRNWEDNPNYMGWLVYDKEKDRMFCRACKDAGQTRHWVLEGSNNFQNSTLLSHLRSAAAHQAAIRVPKLREPMQAVQEVFQSEQEEKVTNLLRHVLWMCKEDLAMAK